MNERIKQLAEQAGFMLWDKEPWNPGDVIDCSTRYDDELKKFSELIVKECNRLNQKQSFELAGVVADVEQGDGFDGVCLDTVKRVERYLSSNILKKHFGVEE